jgi:hypothetical protein
VRVTVSLADNTRAASALDVTPCSCAGVCVYVYVYVYVCVPALPHAAQRRIPFKFCGSNSKEECPFAIRLKGGDVMVMAGDNDDAGGCNCHHFNQYRQLLPLPPTPCPHSLTAAAQVLRAHAFTACPSSCQWSSMQS